MIPTLRGGSPYFPPSVNFDNLERIREMLQAHTSPLTVVRVINPRYEWVRVVTQVVFAKGKDEGFYQQQLNEDLRRLLSPWFYDKTFNLTTGNVIYKDSIISYIENLPYVGYIHQFKLEKIVEEVDADGNRQFFVTERGDQLVEGTYPWSILISHREHLITAIQAGQPTDATQREGIGTMTVSDDFLVGLRSGKLRAKRQGFVKLDPPSPPSTDGRKYYLLIKKP